MDTTHGAPGDDLVLLDEWHVEVFVAPVLSAELAQDLRSQIDADLSSWTLGLAARLNTEATVRVAIDQ